MVDSLLKVSSEASLAVAVDDEWFHSLHTKNEWQPPAPFFPTLRDKLWNLASKPPSTPSTAILQRASSTVLGASHRRNAFMGPMCSPFTRSSAAQHIDADAYVVTEKSDGVRVIIVSMAVAMPRWIIEGGSPWGFALFDTFSLEAALGEMLQRMGDAPPSTEDRSCAVSLSIGESQLTVDIDGGMYVLIPGTERRAVQRIVTHRHFTYVFDRSMSITALLLDEYPMINCLEAVLDAELLRTVGDAPQWRLAVFDMFACRPKEEVDLVLLNRETYENRVEWCRKHVIDPMRVCCRGVQCPFRVDIAVKTLYPCSEIHACLQRIQRGKHGQYVYNGETPNDGLVFTPKQFDVVIGSHASQLKWKWPDRLSVDWHLKPLVGTQSLSSDPIRVERRLYFKKKRQSGDVEGPVFAGLCFMSNPNGIALPSEGCVFECGLEVRSGTSQWTILAVRSDKRDGNAVTVALSVVESMAEKLGQEELLKLVHHPKLHPDVPTVSDDNTSVFTPKPCLLGVVALVDGDGGTTLWLQWTVQIEGTKKDLSCPYVKVAQCYGLGVGCPAVDPQSPLIDLVSIALANAGGCFMWSTLDAEVLFDVRVGRWCILRLMTRGSYKPNFRYVLEHLCSLRKAQLEGSAIDFGMYGSVICGLGPPRIAPTDVHYAATTENLRHGCGRSSLRRFNNWVKTMKLMEAVRVAESGTSGVALLDLCCGRGGDLPKWPHCQVTRLVAVDSCMEAVGEAARRYSVGKGLSTNVSKGQPGYPGLPATFVVANAFQWDSLATSPAGTGAPYDVVSCQFSMHYAFDSEASVRGFLDVVSRSLRPGGIFVATTVDDGEILRRRAMWGDRFGSRRYAVAFDAASTPPWGVSYGLTVESSVEGQTEYIVAWDAFLAVAKEFELYLADTQNFREAHHMRHSDEGRRVWNLVAASKRPREEGHPETEEAGLNDEELDAAGLFRVLMLQKGGKS